MKLKKILLTLLTALLTASIAITVVACKNSSGIELVGWVSSKTVTAPIDSIYTIEDKSIKDTNGNVYYYDILVKDSKGQKAVCIAGQFEVLDPNGYTINYTLELTDKDVRKRTVKVNVVDGDAPTITVSMPTGFVNSIYSIPQIVVTDSSSTGIKPTYFIYKKADENKTPIKITNGKFIPTQTGTYVIDITATDIEGNVAHVEKEFGVRSPASENVLENFDDEVSLLNSVNGANQEWLSTFEGRTGVVHIKAQDMEKTAYKFKFIREREAYKHTPFNAITVSIYVSKYGDFYQTDMEGEGAYWTGITTGSWFEYTITEFGDWAYLFDSATSDKGAQLFWSWTRNIDVYIDEIRFDATPNVVLNSNAVDGKVNAGSEVEVKAVVPTDDRLTVSLAVQSPSGAKVTVTNDKFIAEEIGRYTLTATVESAEYSYYDTAKTFELISLGRYVKIGEEFTENDIGTNYVITEGHQVGNEFTLPQGELIDPITNETLSSTVEVAVTFNNESVTVTDGKFIPTNEGKYTLTYTAEYDGKTYVSTGIVYSIDLTLKSNELENFSERTSANRVKYGLDGQGTGQTPEWLPEFQGRVGVIKLNDNARENGYMFKLNMSYEELLAIKWDYICISLYLTSGDWLCYGNNVENAMGAINTSTVWAKNEWTTLTIPKTKIENVESFMKALTGTRGAHLFWGWDLGDPIYVDSITFRVNGDVLNDFAIESTKSENLNGGNGVGSNPTWVQEFGGKNGVLKVNDGGQMGGYYFRTNNFTATDLENTAWDYIEITLYATNSSWIYFYDTAMNVQLQNGAWVTVKLTKDVITAEMTLKAFCESITGANGIQLFWSYDDLGDVYFDCIKIGKNA